MDHKITIFAMLFRFAFLITRFPISITASPPIPALFAFGNSTLDTGNNNFAETLFRADHRPYGRDIPGHIPSGRFRNGKLTTDYLVSKLGIKRSLAGLPQPEDLTTGVSFPSTGSRLDHATTALNRVLQMKRQLRNFDEAMKRRKKAVEREKCEELVWDALFVISVGTNDVIFSLYGLSQPNDLHSQASKYHDFLLQRLSSFIQILYDRGSRKFGVAGIPRMGCLPLQLAIGATTSTEQTPNRTCADQQNADSEAYNVKLQALLSSLKSSLSGSKIIYLEIYEPMMDYLLREIFINTIF